MTLVILTMLVLATTTLAYVYEHRTWLLVDWVWAETIVGCTVCLLAASAIAWLVDPALWPGVLMCWVVFVVGGTPIVAWSVGRMVRLRDQAIKRNEDGKAATMAATGRQGED